MIKEPGINHPTKGHLIQLKGQYTCNSNAVIYFLKCPCGKYYVGQTSRAVKIRINEHRSSIRTYLYKNIEERAIIDKTDRKYGETSVAQHFAAARHSVSDLRWAILEQIYEQNIGNLKNKLLRRETYWIVELDTMAPKGLNENCCFSAFL